MRSILTLALSLCIFFSTAQDTLSFSKWSVTCQALGIVDPFLTNFTIGIQYSFNKKVHAEIRSGVIQTWFCLPQTEPDFSNTVNRDEQNIQKSGFTISGDVKYFINTKVYLAVQLFYRDYIQTDNENLWRFAQSYVQRFDIEKSIEDVGGNIIMGYHLEHKSERVYCEFFAGVGIMNSYLKILNELPPDAELINNGGFEQNGNFDNDMPGNNIQPSYALGITIGYKL